MRAVPELKLRSLLERRAELVAEIEALQNKMLGLDMAIALFDGEDTLPVATGPGIPPARRQTAEHLLLELLREAGSAGLNAYIVADIAARRGVRVNRSSMSSMLSRMKRDGLLVYEDARYKLKEFGKAPDREAHFVRSATNELAGQDSDKKRPHH
jgi:hypothetical protein